MLSRFRRYKDYHDRILGEDLNVSVVSMWPGEPFDPTRQHVRGTVESSDGRLAGVVEVVHTPLFEWSDDYGQPQTIPAGVTVSTARLCSKEESQ